MNDVNQELPRDYVELLKKLNLEEFSITMHEFIAFYRDHADNVPVHHVFRVLYAPCDVPRPMLEIFFRDDDTFDIVALIEDVDTSLKKYLVGLSDTVEEFSTLRKMSDDFMIIIRRESDVSRDKKTVQETA